MQRLRMPLRMGLQSSVRRGAPRRRMEGVSYGEVYHRVGLLLAVRHGHAREVDDREGPRPVDREVADEAVRRLPERGGMAGASLRTPGAKKAKKGQAVSPDVAAVCSKASKRLKSRFDHLVGQGLPVNKAKIAVVNELIRWIWVIGKMVQAEQRALAAHS